MRRTPGVWDRFGDPLRGRCDAPPAFGRGLRATVARAGGVAFATTIDMRTTSVLFLALAILALGCPPERGGTTPSTPGSCNEPAHTVLRWNQDTGMGVNVCIWVDNDSSESLWVSDWREWDISLCGGQPNDLTRPETLVGAIEIPPGESAEILGWFGACDREAATLNSGAGEWEPQYVFYVSQFPDDDSCWNETRSPRLDGWYCEG